MPVTDLTFGALPPELSPFHLGCDVARLHYKYWSPQQSQPSQYWVHAPSKLGRACFSHGRQRDAKSHVLLWTVQGEVRRGCSKEMVLGPTEKAALSGGKWAAILGEGHNRDTNDLESSIHPRTNNAITEEKCKAAASPEVSPSQEFICRIRH